MTASRSPLDAIPPSVLVFSGIVSVQAGAGLAGRMFSQLGPAGVTGLRLWWAALIIAALAGRGVGRTVRQAVADRAWRDLARNRCRGGPGHRGISLSRSHSASCSA